MSEELTWALSQVSALRVVSGISARHYKGSDKTAAEIARELGGIELLPGGSVTRAGDHVRINVYADDVATDRRVWSQAYERALGHSRDLFNEATRDFVAEFGVAVVGGRAARLASRHPINRDAHEAYLRGLCFRERELDGGCFQAERLKAVALDATFAQPHAMLAFCHGANRFNNQPAPGRRKSRERPRGRRRSPGA